MSSRSSISESSQTFGDFSDDENFIDGEIQTYNMDSDEDIEMGSSGSQNVEYLSIDQVHKLMEDAIKNIQDVVELPRQETKILLNFFKWEELSLLEKFYEEGRTKLFKLANIEYHSDEKAMPCVSSKVCQICFESADCITSRCGHCSFCNDCYTQYLTTKIVEEGVGENLTCPAFKCNFVLEEAMVLSMISCPSVKEKYKYLIINKFVTHNRLLKFCPEPHCTTVVKSEMVQCSVKCKCGVSFCFKCGENMHEPVHCDIVERWENLVKTDGGSRSWIYENTKVSYNFFDKFNDRSD
jgi:ariadne-1